MKLEDIGGKEERKPFLKKIYDYCEDANWDSIKLQKIAESLDVNVERIRAWGKIYLRDYMGLTKEAYEKEVVYIHNKIMAEKAYFGYNIPTINPVLLQHGINSNKIWNNAFERKIVLKYIYDSCESSEYNEEHISLLASEFKITKETIKRYAKTYALEFLDIDEEQYYLTKLNYILKHKKETLNQNGKIINVLEQLLQSHTLEEYIDIIESSAIELKYIRAGVVNYLRLYGDLKDEEYLRDKIREYSEYKNSERKKLRERTRQEEQEKQIQAQLPQAKSLVEKFIHSDCISIDDFCQKNDIKNRKIFEENVKIVAQKDVSLYQEYSNKIKRYQGQRLFVIIKILTQITYLINNGILLEDGTKRNFDLIDYYLSTKVTLSNALRIINSQANSEDYRGLKTFIRMNLPYSKPNPIDIKAIVDDGNKDKILDYLNTNDIPANMKTYNLAIMRYKKGLLDLNQEKVKKKIRRPYYA